jgi:hypothetical protein
VSKQLHERSLTELRAMASAVGVTVSFADTKSKLVDAIRKTVDAKSAKPLPFRAIGVKPEEGSSQANIITALKPLIDRGLIVTFPDADSWFMTRNKKEDSGSMNIPLLSIVRCAEAIFK